MESPLWLLKLDIDSGMPVPTVGRVAAILRRAGYRLLWWRQDTSASGRGLHIALRVTPKCRTAMEQVALQAALGSDPFRESCNVLRVRALPKLSPYWRARWNVLYKGR